MRAPEEEHDRLGGNRGETVTLIHFDSPLPCVQYDGNHLRDNEGCVYMYVLDDGRKYVGQTKTGLNARHSSHLRADCPVDIEIRSHKYWLTTLAVASLSGLDKLEQKYIARYNTMYPNGLNRTSGGILGYTWCEDSNIKRTQTHEMKWLDPVFRELHSGVNSPTYGRKASDELRKKLSLAHIGKNMGDEHPRSRAVLQVDQETGEIIRRWGSMTMAANACGARESDIWEVCTGRVCTSAGYIWVDDSDAGRAEIPLILKRIQKKYRAKSIRVRWLDKDGNVLGEFESGAEGARASGYSTTSVCNSCKGKTKLKSGERWEYIRED